MKTNTWMMLLLFLITWGAGTARAVDLTVDDSVINLATNVTKNYTFADPASGQSIVVAVTMTPYSSSNASPGFTLLDDYGPNNTPVHLGIDSGLGGGDGNWVDGFEGVNFSASLVSASGGVDPSSIQFGVAGLGIRLDSGFLIWTSSAVSNYFSLPAESLAALDTALTPLAATTYHGELRNSDLAGQYQLSDLDSLAGQSVELNASFAVTSTNLTDPRTNSWFTTEAGQYARIYTNSAMQAAGTALTTWSNGSENQTNPAYCGVQEVYSSSNWVYVRSTGLASYTMGPWYLNSQHNMAFPNLPANQKLLYRFPRTNSVPATKTVNGGGQIGIFVDGVEMFNSWDAYTWSPAASADEQNITGYWNRDAYVNEGATFDPGYAHQQNTGVYHYHADPIALRYLLGDHVDYDAATKTYAESTNAPTKHSPILAWTTDGYPVYGPYGYANATNANSGLRRMVSGYVIRNGQYGTSNLAANGRITIPQWAVRLFNVSSNQSGPAVSTSYPLGRYMEDNDYLGDHGYVQGVDFDLDEYNGRWCVTPEFPQGTYAYFVAIGSDGTPVFPYNIGRGFYGNPTGGSVAGISETVTTNFLGYTNLASTLNPPVVKNRSVVLTWSALEGGSYQVRSATNLANGSWTLLASGVSPNKITGSYTNSGWLNQQYFRVARTGVATYDSAGTTTLSSGSVAPGGSASQGQTVTLTITLPSTPPWPPASAPISSAILTNLVAHTGISGTSISDSTQGQVLATFAIPANATTGSDNVVVTFTTGPAYTLTNGFTINP